MKDSHISIRIRMNIKKFISTVVLLILVSAPTLVIGQTTKSLDLLALDNTISPKSDFYHYVNKKWQERHPLTGEYSSYGQFDILRDSSEQRVQRIVMGLGSTNPRPGTNAYKISTLYALGMDSARRNRDGAAPLSSKIEKIENTKPEDMRSLFRWMHRYESKPLFLIMIFEDLANSQRYAMYVRSTTLGMGSRDYYLLDDKRSIEVRRAYIKLIEKEMSLAGYSRKDAQRIAKNVLKIETMLADSTWTQEQSRNIPAMYNPRLLSQVEELYPNLPIKEIIGDMGIEVPETIIVTELNTIKQADNLMKMLAEREKKDYYLWEIVSAASGYLSDDFADADFEFYKTLSGVEQRRPRWKNSLEAVEKTMGEAIGQLYVEQYFPESSKIYMDGLVANLRKALGKHIINLPWMTDDTKYEALKKLNATTVKIGYPDKWKDYSKLIVDSSLTYYENIHNADLWAYDRQLEKWGKPVDRSEWSMTPQTINAYANALYNEIVFPAGILQAPFFDPEASDAENYGGIGVVIGHELTHGFDDQGCNFDADGNMINWWTDSDRKAFAEKTKGLGLQFDAIEVLPGLYANGTYTMGENIADQGGLRIAYTAFLDSQKKKGLDLTSGEIQIEGFSPIQIFYMNYANVWANNIRDEEVRNLTATDPHSLGINRVNVTIRNIEPFMQAFDIKEGDAMFCPESKRIIIW